MPQTCGASLDGGSKCHRPPCLKAKFPREFNAKTSCKNHIETLWSSSFQDTGDEDIKRISNRFYDPLASDLSGHESNLQWIRDAMEKKGVSDMVDDDDIRDAYLELLTTKDIQVKLSDLRMKNGPLRTIPSSLLMFPNQSRTLREEAGAVAMIRAAHSKRKKETRDSFEHRRASGNNSKTCTCLKKEVMAHWSTLKSVLQFKCWGCLQNALIELSETYRHLSLISELQVLMWQNPMYDPDSSDPLLGTPCLTLRIGSAIAPAYVNPAFQVLGSGNVIAVGDSMEKKEQFRGWVDTMTSEHVDHREKDNSRRNASMKAARNSMQDTILAESYGGKAPTVTQEQIDASLRDCSGKLDSAISRLSSPTNILLGMGNVSSLEPKKADKGVTLSIYNSEDIRKLVVTRDAFVLTPAGNALAREDFDIYYSLDKMLNTAGTGRISVCIQRATGPVSQEASRLVEEPLIKLIQSKSPTALISSEGSRYSPGLFSQFLFSQTSMVIVSGWLPSVLSRKSYLSADLAFDVRNSVTKAVACLRDLSYWKFPNDPLTVQQRLGQVAPSLSLAAAAPEEQAAVLNALPTGKRAAAERKKRALQDINVNVERELKRSSKAAQREIPRAVAGKSVIVLSGNLGESVTKDTVKSFLEDNQWLELECHSSFPSGIAQLAGRYIFVKGRRASSSKVQTAEDNNITTWTPAQLINFMAMDDHA